MMEAHYSDGRVERQIVPLTEAALRMQELLADPTLQEVRTRKIEVGEEVEVEGRTLRFTDAGWRRVDRRDPMRTHELTPVERRMVGLSRRHAAR